MGPTFFGMRRFTPFLLIGATDKSKISGDCYRIQFDINLYGISLLLFVTTPFKPLHGSSLLSSNLRRWIPHLAL